MSKQAYVALVTCFNEDETINYEATRAQVRRQVEAGNNIMCAGTNGDFTALTHDEKIRLTEQVVEEVGGRVKVIVNAGMPATFETLKLAREFDRIGVDGIAVITPFFIACTQDGLIRHFSTIADAVKTPVYLYDIPARTQNHIEPETARKLAGHGNIAGIKDSGGAQETLAAYLQVAKEVPGFEVYSGPDHLVLWSLQNGAAGCISGLGNAMPDVLAGILAAFNAGDIAEAERQQAIYTAFRTDLYALGFAPAMVKRSLYMQDASVGASRQPALLPDPEQDEQIREILRRYNRL
ncbi:dihydrodipicolinate synthase family protein [Neorhizobium sp. T786]|uniref:dihydrodipicolinate synthase family protein n=1 Tax=Pseudorhizobium xiangyangii TaxID=2883104 RepID=UPI001CFFA530|nr:dihydrodipicolinate synthase family protein [Neorhizobium xiangyangii]MCB5202003.1 dihydrodipicolinate synthase family protein [Neorhizobium xiangyangii]